VISLRSSWIARRAILAVLLGLLAVPAGCGTTDADQAAVQGTVTYQGKAVPAGLIVFEPDVAAGNQGPSGFATIKDGRYSTRDSGKGVRPGSVTLWISGFDGVNAADSDSGMGKPLFSTYKTSGQVTVSMAPLDVEVPASHR
jgi:hypothetical protein